MDNSKPYGPENPEIINPKHQGARIVAHVEPGNKWLSLPRPKTARQLLQALDLPDEGALIARDGKLLTPDKHIWPNEEIFVRVVASRG